MAQLKVDPASVAAWLLRNAQGQQICWNVACKLWPGRKLSGAMPGGVQPMSSSEKKVQISIGSKLVLFVILLLIGYFFGYPFVKLIFLSVRGTL
jgi:hypothetical protein